MIASTAATNAAASEAAAKEAQIAAEKARDEAQGIAGGDFASVAYVDNKASEAETKANSYTDRKISAIPAPDVSGQIGDHNADSGAHSDIRTAVSNAQAAADSKAPMLKLKSNLTGVGWFRVGLINTDGTSSSVTRIAIGAIYSNVAPSTVVLDVMRVHSEVEIYQQVGITNDTGITQVRACLIDWKTLAFDVYVNTTLENPYNINIMPIMGSFTPSSFENVTSGTVDVKASISLTDGGSYASVGHTHTPADIGAPTVDEMNSAITSAIGSAIGGSY